MQWDKLIRIVFAVVTITLTAVTLSLPGATSLPSERGQIGEVETKDVRVSDLAFIQGRWYTEREGGQLEEVWSAPTGDSMMGMFRWIKEGKIWIYQLLTIRNEDVGLVFRFRHFSNELVPWEPKEEPLTFNLLRFKEAEAVFENPEQDSPRRYTFIKNGQDGLRVWVQGYQDGKLGPGSVFDYRRR